MGTTAHRSGMGAAGRCSVGLACLLAVAACSGRERASNTSDATGSPGPGAAEVPSIPAADSHISGGAVNEQSTGGTTATPTQDSHTSGPQAGQRKKSRADELAGAPRADPNAPPKPRVNPDTNPTKSQPKDTSPADEPPRELHDKYHTAPKDTVSEVVYTGWKYFNLNCARCHGEDVSGTTLAPHLIDSFKSGKVDHDEFWRVVHGSRAEKGMPNWSGIIDDQKLEAIYQYVKGRSDGKLHPGRPAQRSG